ncbi:MAG: hypothetical protein COB37_04955 [Kordiimonadales bacterium]|nr:MAG: hypothetical protein COB37_04955 [Kordiimonadales bacterium]
MKEPTKPETKGQRQNMQQGAFVGGRKKRQKLETIMGWRIAPPRLIFWGYITGLKYIALPILAALLLIDVALYFFFGLVLDKCYGILCLL